MKKILITLAAIALIITSCAKNEIVEPETPQARTVRVTATIPQTTETRTSFYDGTWSNTAGYGFKVKWAVGDKISILCWQGDDATNWGSLIGTDNGEIIHTLVAEDISTDERTINFTFNIPSQITNDALPVKVLLTYLGNSKYIIASSSVTDYNNKPWLDFSKPRIDSATDRAGLMYVTRATPMILRGEISAGWDTGASQAVFNGTFKHLTTLFAVQIKNNTPAPINPRQIYVNFVDGKVANSGYTYWNPVVPSEPTNDNQKQDIYISHMQSIPVGESFVYFVPVYIVTAPTQINVSYNDNADISYYFPSTSTKTTSITLQAGKCYTLNVQVNSIIKTGDGARNTDFAWNTATPVQAPY